MSFALFFLSLCFAATVEVDSSEALRAAVEGAVPGDEIVILPGRYSFTSKVSAGANGDLANPIVVRSSVPGQSVIDMDTVEGFYVTGTHWRFEDLWINGVCADDNTCEHAFHLVGDADGTMIRNTVMSNFNAQIKSNQNSGAFPDDVVIEGCEFFNDAPRQTANPVTPVDVVGGQRWVVRGNYFHDFAKAQGNQISYAAFFKGNSRDGRFENNLVVCEQLHQGQVRLGLSLGGGGSSPDSICEEQDCSTEHTGGVLLNNIIAHCPSDVGIYLNKAADTQVLHNTVYNTTGIDVRFDVSDAFLDGNVVSGSIRERDGGVATEGFNLTNYGDFSGTYADPDNLDFTVVDATDIVDGGNPEVVTDFCWNPRNGYADLGATEGGVSCDTSVAAGAPGSGGSGPGTSTGSSGSGSGTTTGTGTGGDATGGGPMEPGSGADMQGCGCASVSPATLWWGLVMLAVLTPRRRQ